MSVRVPDPAPQRHLGRAQLRLVGRLLRADEVETVAGEQRLEVGRRDAHAQSPESRCRAAHRRRCTFDFGLLELREQVLADRSAGAASACRSGTGNTASARERLSRLRSCSRAAVRVAEADTLGSSWAVACGNASRPASARALATLSWPSLSQRQLVAAQQVDGRGRRRVQAGDDQRDRSARGADRCRSVSSHVIPPSSMPTGA